MSSTRKSSNEYEFYQNQAYTIILDDTNDNAEPKNEHIRLSLSHSKNSHGYLSECDISCLETKDSCNSSELSTHQIDLNELSQTSERLNVSA